MAIDFFIQLIISTLSSYRHLIDEYLYSLSMVGVKPFLVLPFKKQLYKVTEGWRYSEHEKAIHGFTGHAGIDFELPRGTEIFAAADGWTISSYFNFIILKDGKPLLYQEKEIGLGLGNFVQIYHHESGLYTAYGHLETIDKVIPFHKPRKVGTHFWPIGHKINPNKLVDYSKAVFIKRGQSIGRVGDSGLTLGYYDYPTRPDPEQYPSWDEVHLHFEVFSRIGGKKIKKYLDPYGIKGGVEDYPDSSKQGTKLGEKSSVLWILDNHELPVFIN